MEKVEGLMEKMKLSDTEKKGIRIGGAQLGKGKATEAQAVGKILSEKPVRAEEVELAVGKIWCPIKGIDCNDLGENRFLITFFQASGKRRALDEGPWMVSKDLIVMTDFDGRKTVDELQFDHIPIWVRVMKMPLGMMNKTYGEAIGKVIGTFMEMEVDEDNSAVGQFLRIKVRLDIRKPLMRGVTLHVEEEEGEKEVWCPFVYEFLPDFCYTCGIIGHTENLCERKLGKDEVPQFSKKMRFIPPKKRYQLDHMSRGVEQRNSLPWRVGGSGSKGSGGGSRSWGSGSRSGSDAPSWRKGELSEVTSPPKLTDGKERKGERGTKKVLFGDGEDSKKGGEKAVKEQDHAKAPLPPNTDVVVATEDKTVVVQPDVNSSMNSMHVDQTGVTTHAAVGQKEEGKKGKTGTYKKYRRESGGKSSEDVSKEVPKKKRELEQVQDMEIDGGKRAKVLGSKAVVTDANTKKAGPADRSCTDQ